MNSDLKEEIINKTFEKFSEDPDYMKTIEGFLKEEFNDDFEQAKNIIIKILKEKSYDLNSLKDYKNISNKVLSIHLYKFKPYLHDPSKNYECN